MKSNPVRDSKPTQIMMRKFSSFFAPALLILCFVNRASLQKLAQSWNTSDCASLLDNIESNDTDSTELATEFFKHENSLVKFYEKLWSCPLSDSSEKARILFASMPWETFNGLYKSNGTVLSETHIKELAKLYLLLMPREVYENSCLETISAFLRVWNPSTDQQSLERLYNYLNSQNISISSTCSDVPAINVIEYYMLEDGEKRSYTSVFRKLVDQIAPLNFETFKSIRDIKTRLSYFLYGGKRNPEIYSHLDKDTFLKMLDDMNNNQDLESQLLAKNLYSRSGFFSELYKRPEEELSFKISSSVSDPNARITKYLVERILLHDPKYEGAVIYFLELFKAHFSHHLLKNETDADLDYYPYNAETSASVRPQNTDPNASSSSFAMPPTMVLITWVTFGFQILIFIIVIIYVISLKVRYNRKERLLYSEANAPINNISPAAGKISGSIWTRE